MTHRLVRFVVDFEVEDDGARVAETFADVVRVALLWLVKIPGVVRASIFQV